LSEILIDQNKPALVNMSLVLHHLEDPVSVLSKIRNILPDNSIIIAETVNDALKNFYPDESQRLQKVIEISQHGERPSDRFHGKKIITQFVRAGYYNVCMESQMITNHRLSKSEKENLFQIAFEHRSAPLLRCIEQSQSTNIQACADLELLEQLLKELEKDFVNNKESFYIDYLLAAVAIVK
jgi:hypothetical protein